MKKPAAKNKYAAYRSGGDGLVKWAEDRVWVSIYPIGSEFAVWVPLGSAKLSDTVICPQTGRSYREMWCEVNPETGRSYQFMWDKQKQVLREALAMEGGQFVHRLIVLCWQRGEGKSFLAVLILLWKWDCWPKQDIRLCANSKDQTSHAHLSIAKDIILNSPKLLKNIGKKNILDKELRRRNARGHVVSKMEIISSASGIFSNINGYAFSEIFELKDHVFWDKVDGNIRNVPNAFGVIDTTVSSKEHLLYHLYDGFIKGKDPLTYFSYRCSEKLDFRDYWHPNQTQAQLNSYKIKQPLTYAKQFKNLWSAGAEKIFSAEQIDAMNYMGAEGVVDHPRVIELIQRKYKIMNSDTRLIAEGVDVYRQDLEINQVDSLLWPVEEVYQLLPTHTGSVMASSEVLDDLGNMFDTDWAVIAGLDRAQPFKRRTSARTIYVALAKGLPGSRSNPDIGVMSMKDLDPKSVNEYMIHGPAYIYFYLQIADIIDHSLEGLKDEVLLTHEEFDGIDVIGSETWSAFDLKAWAEVLSIDVVLWHPAYARQLGAFTELFTLVNDGRLKTPPCVISGSRGSDIISEEFNNFDHDADTRWFGSPEKNLKDGIQDDLVYATGWCIYGGRELTVHNFRPRLKSLFTGTIIQPAGLLGNYV
jgi:hypothetical protein